MLHEAVESSMQRPPVAGEVPPKAYVVKAYAASKGFAPVV
jgi:hypothetical protein